MKEKWYININFKIIWRFLLTALILLNIQQVKAAEQEHMVTIEKQGQENSPVFYVNNEYHCPVEIEILLTRSVNITTEPKLPAKFIIPAVSKSKVFTLQPAQADISFSYNYQYRFTIGDPNAKHRPPKPYCPPFPNGNRFRISNSFKNNSNLNQGYNTYAVNIIIPEGVPICAARSGLVIDITSESYIINTGRGKIKGYTDVLRILHDDGTMGVYAHLKNKSIMVASGENIKEKQMLAKSGNSGESGVSYLHFSVQKNAGMKLVSLPFQFQDKDRKGITPETGMILRTDW